MNRLATLLLLLLAVPSALAQATVSLDASPLTVSEDGGVSTLTATLSAATTEDVTITLGTAGDSDAFALASSTITIDAGDTDGTTTLTASDDDDFDDESVTVSIQDIAGNDGGVDDPTEDGDQAVTVTIADDDVPLVRLAASDLDISEGETSILTVALEDGATADGAVVVNLGYSGSNISGRYTSPAQITIPDGASSATATLTAVDDDDFDGDVAVIVAISTVTGDAEEDGVQNRTITIREDDDSPATVTLQTNRSEIDEDGGTATLTVRLSKTSTEATTVTIAESTDSDAFELADSEVTIPAGQRTATTTVTGVDDDDFNDDDLVFEVISVSGGEGAFEATDQIAEITVLDDDIPAVTLTLGDATIVEGDSTEVTVTLQSGAFANGDISISLEYLYDDGDDDPSDNTGELDAPDEVVISDGENSASVWVIAVDDEQFESNATVTVSIDDIDGSATEDEDQEATFIVSDNDGIPEVAFETEPSVIAESNGTSQLTATLSNTTDQRVALVLSYIGSASRGSDYVAPDTVFVEPGDLTGSAPLRSIGGDDRNEQIFIQVEEAINAIELGGPDGQQEILTLNPDLNQITAAFAMAELEADEDAETLEIEVTLMPAPEDDVSVRVTLDADASTGTAADLGGETRQTANFDAGETTATVTFSITDDAIFEGDETLVFRLTNASGAVPLGDSLTVTIVDNDTDSELLVSEYDGIIGGAGDEFVELISDGGGALADGLSLAFYGPDSTVTVVNDLGGLATDEDGFLVVSGGDEGISIPDSFLGVAVFRGDGPDVGDAFDPTDGALVDAVLIDEEAAADEQGLFAGDGSLQRQESGAFAFVVPPTPGDANGVGAVVAIDPDVPVTEVLVSDVFPNPSAGRAAIEVAVPTAEAIRVEVFDALGRSVLVAHDGDVRSGSIVRVPLSGRSLPAGVYAVRVSGETFAETRQLTVAR